MALSLIEHEDLDKLPDGELSSSTEHSFYPASLVQVLRVTHQAKCNLIKVISCVISIQPSKLMLERSRAVGRGGGGGEIHTCKKLKSGEILGGEASSGTFLHHNQFYHL